MYDGTGHIREAIDAGEHRRVIGGAWEEIGALQLQLLIAQGLRPAHRLLDIGCGSLRLGVRAVDYLDAGQYWGSDLHAALMNSGYERELQPAGLAHKLPRTQLVEDAEFRFPGIPRQLDFAIATSVFTHLPLNHLRLCLRRLQQHLETPCVFLFSVFLAPSAAALDDAIEQRPGGPLTRPHIDPYHYLVDDIAYAAATTGWRIDQLGNCDHPRGQIFFRAAIG
jgi:cyclopropane fatty-acyl-phospholipid synthase-like methyltransferase